jgi:hypothetical protein
MPSSSTPSAANIPLHSLSRRRYDSPSDDQESLLGSPVEKDRSSLEGSDFSFFEESGDIVDEYDPDEDDPLRTRIRESLERQLPQDQKKKGGRHQKQVHYHPDVRSYNEKRGKRIRKEDIPIPNPPRRPLSFGHRLLATVMAPGDGPSRIHGLHGKKLMYGIMLQ